jgi:two-component system sensor histidine kinase ChiS
MLNAIEKYNFARLSQNQMPIRVGIGINTGTVVIGTVGFHDRIDCTVISDVVNVASRVEKLNKAMNCNLLITENTFNALNNPMQFNYRYLGQHILPGKKIELGIYEIFDGDNKEIIPLKQKTKEIFNRAIQCYDAKELKQAEKLFNQIIRINPHDRVARTFLEKKKSSS